MTNPKIVGFGRGEHGITILYVGDTPPDLPDIGEKVLLIKDQSHASNDFEEIDIFEQ